ncbi:ParA family protein [Paraclostridium bifermentans]|uniref:ParA family protein n=1 Tax=Paraclostridium bifermentans TaxID=1490 RepID=UPI001FF3ED2C|nr:ParA family protein [Paraclostridium bifermentans]UOW69723.1 ParA family protein [Paraclostridium bifermentans]
MKICSFFNVKGGVGKTTLTILTAMKLSKEGKKVLLIDADTQANLTQFLYKVVHDDKTLFQMLTENTTAKEVILKSPVEEFKNIDIIPSDISLSVLSEYLSTQMGREKAVWRWFKNNIEDIEKYDYVFVDLSPSYDLIARNFMLISDSIITPIEYQDIASIRGCELFYQKFKQDLEFLDIKLKTKRAVVINSYTTRKLSTGDLFNSYLDKFENIQKDLVQAKISETTVVRNAILNKMDLEDYCRKTKKAHKVRSDFNEFIEELKAKEVL